MAGDIAADWCHTGQRAQNVFMKIKQRKEQINFFLCNIENNSLFVEKLRSVKITIPYELCVNYKAPLRYVDVQRKLHTSRQI